MTVPAVIEGIANIVNQPGRTIVTVRYGKRTALHSATDRVHLGQKVMFDPERQKLYTTAGELLTWSPPE